jgi:hypothetical protein
MRPASFPGNSLGFLWAPAYRIYLEIDHSYADLENHFVEALAIMSLFEACVVAIALWLNQSLRGELLAHLLVVIVTCLTAAKTLIFFIVEACYGWHSIGHNELLPLLFGYVLPNSLWVFMPIAAAVHTGQELLKRSR